MIDRILASIAPIALALPLLGCSAASAALKVGDPAPPFRLPGSDGKTHSLSDYRGKQVVILAWFPKAFTSG